MYKIEGHVFFMRCPSTYTIDKMIRTSLLILFFAVCGVCSGQPINKRYSTYLSSNGTIYFFNPKKLIKRVNADRFTYDMTYISHGDSVTVNCSVEVKENSMIKQMVMKNANKSYLGKSVSMLYRDVMKNGYLLRITSKFSILDITEMFQSSTPLIFEFTLTDGTRCILTYSESQWKKESHDVSRIIESLN